MANPNQIPRIPLPMGGDGNIINLDIFENREVPLIRPSSTPILNAMFSPAYDINNYIRDIIYVIRTKADFERVLAAIPENQDQENQVLADDIRGKVSELIERLDERLNRRNDDGDLAGGLAGGKKVRKSRKSRKVRKSRKSRKVRKSRKSRKVRKSRKTKKQ
jgi:hypothetical protein